MALSTTAEITTAVGDWLNRTDLTDAIPDFITIAEAKITRRVRKKTLRADLVLDSDAVTLPATCAELRSIWLSSDAPSQDRPIRIVTPEVLAERRAATGAVAGRPVWAAVVEQTLLLVPEPDQAYTAKIICYEKLVPLATTTVNSLLTDAPDVYLYGALVAAEPYLRNDERLPLWKQQFDEAVLELDAAREREEHGASLPQARLSRVF